MPLPISVQQGLSPTPFYIVQTASGKDLTGYITRFAYEDCTEKDDLVKLSMEGVSVSQVDDADMQPGKEIVFRFGYFQGLQSFSRRAVISDIDVSFGKTISLSLTATDAGQALKKTESGKIWKKQSSSQIADAIAAQYGLQKKIEATEKIHESIPQGNRTDFELLKYLTTLEPNFIFYIKEKTLVFKKRDLDAKPGLSLFYNRPGQVLSTNDLISFKPSNKDSKKTGASNNVAVVAFDPTKKKEETAKADAKTTSADTQLGKGNIRYNENAKIVQDENRTGKKLALPAGKDDKNKTIAENKKKTASLKDLTATCQLQGNPALIADTLVTIQGVGKIYGGNYYITKVSHTIDSSGYLTSLELNRNASGSGKPTDNSSQSNKNVNEQKGNKDSQVKKEVQVYNADGKPVKR